MDEFRSYSWQEPMDATAITIPNNLDLSDEQTGLLRKYKIDPSIPDTIHIIKGHEFHNILSGVDGYFADQYLFFFNGTANQHYLFMKYVFGQEYKPFLCCLYAGVSVYGSPLEKYKRPENTVAVTVHVEAPLNYQM